MRRTWLALAAGLALVTDERRDRRGHSDGRDGEGRDRRRAAAGR